MVRLLVLFLIALCVVIVYRKIIESLQKALKEPRRRDSASAHPQGTDSRRAIEAHHREVLGVSEAAGEDEIKTAYRSQLAKYHPDKVTHLGDEFHKLADARTKDIIAAYEYLKQKYGFK